MDLIMSALTLCAQFINYDPLIITMLNGAKKCYSAAFPCCDVDSGRHGHASCTFLIEEQVDSYKTHTK